MMKGVVLAMLVVVAVVAQQGEAVQCGEILVALAPCENYLTGDEAKPPERCCEGVRRVKEIAASDKRAACSCVKQAAISFPRLSDAAAQSLPIDCGVHLDIPVSRSVDCTKIWFGACVASD